MCVQKVLIVQENAQYVELVNNCKFLELATSYEEADILMFTGGSDVNPELYGEAPHPYAHINKLRDEQEVALYEKALTDGKKFVGICRGGQFLNVMNGGRLYQHVDGHATGKLHPVHTTDGRRIMVTSTHHQMMRPAKEARLLAFTSVSTFKERMLNDEVGRTEMLTIDPEVVWYEETNSLCFQPHPEFVGGDVDDCRNYFYELVEKYL